MHEGTMPSSEHNSGGGMEACTSMYQLESRCMKALLDTRDRGWCFDVAASIFLEDVGDGELV